MAADPKGPKLTNPEANYWPRQLDPAAKARHDREEAKAREQPSPDERRKVEAMAGYGMRRAEIAVIMGIKLGALDRLYSEELERGLAINNARGGQTLTRLAFGAPAEYDEHNRKIRDEVKPHWQTLLFWAERKGGFKRPPMEVTGKDGAPVRHSVEPVDLSGLSDDELGLFAALNEKVLAARIARLSGPAGPDDRGPGGTARSDPDGADPTRH
jgi:hypothetical protein